MEPLIKITTDPIRIEHFRQNGRLVNTNNVDMERRKALARQASFRSSVGQGPVSVDDINKINRVFSKKQAAATPQPSETNSAFQQKLISNQSQPQPQAQVSTPAPAAVPAADISSAEAVSSSTVSAVASSTASSHASSVPDIALTASSSYTAQRGAFEMRVAKGELSYLPPMVMTVVTQRPQVHIEYLGDFNYFPARVESGGSVNLFT